MKHANKYLVHNGNSRGLDLVSGNLMEEKSLEVDLLRLRKPVRRGRRHARPEIDFNTILEIRASPSRVMGTIEGS